MIWVWAVGVALMFLALVLVHRKLEEPIGIEEFWAMVAMSLLWFVTLPFMLAAYLAEG